MSRCRRIYAGDVRSEEGDRQCLPLFCEESLLAPRSAFGCDVHIQSREKGARRGAIFAGPKSAAILSAFAEVFDASDARIPACRLLARLRLLQISAMRLLSIQS